MADQKRNTTTFGSFYIRAATRSERLDCSRYLRSCVRLCYFTGIFYAVVRQISMSFVDSKDSVFCRNCERKIKNHGRRERWKRISLSAFSKQRHNLSQMFLHSELWASDAVRSVHRPFMELLETDHSMLVIPQLLCRRQPPFVWRCGTA